MTDATLTFGRDGHAYIVVGVPKGDFMAAKWVEAVEKSSHVANRTEAKGRGYGADILQDKDNECALVIKFVKDGMIATSRVYRVGEMP